MSSGDVVGVDGKVTVYLIVINDCSMSVHANTYVSVCEHVLDHSCLICGDNLKEYFRE